MYNAYIDRSNVIIYQLFVFANRIVLTSYRVLINHCVFLNSASSAAALVFYLPGVCTHTDTEGKQRKARVRNILKS